jgi:hypothetical protein
MPGANEESQLSDEASLWIEAPPERIYAIVSDITQMGQLSPECTGGRWLGGATGPEVGARFKGTNRRGFVRWSTTNTVVQADPARAFAFDTKQSGTRWTYELEPDGDGTIVTERRAPFTARPLVAKVTSTVFLGGMAEHEDEMRQGLQATLERLKAVAESG